MENVIVECPCGNEAQKGCSLNGVELCNPCFKTIFPMGKIIVKLGKGTWVASDELMLSVTKGRS
jgi:hypothetical protein